MKIKCFLKIIVWPFPIKGQSQWAYDTLWFTSTYNQFVGKSPKTPCSRPGNWTKPTWLRVPLFLAIRLFSTDTFFEHFKIPNNFVLKHISGLTNSLTNIMLCHEYQTWSEDLNQKDPVTNMATKCKLELSWKNYFTGIQACG